MLLFRGHKPVLEPIFCPEMFILHPKILKTQETWQLYVIWNCSEQKQEWGHPSFDTSLGDPIFNTTSGCLYIKFLCLASQVQ